MDRKIQLAENVRHPFSVPVEIRWMDPLSRYYSMKGVSIDAFVYGLGVILPVSLPVGTEVTVRVHSVEICGSAQVRHVQAAPSGFRMGLQFSLALFLQNIPELDKVLTRSFHTVEGRQNSALAARLRPLTGALRSLRRRGSAAPTLSEI